MRRITGIICLAAGIGLFAWMAADYFLLARLAGEHIFPESGALIWLQGFGSALFSLPGGIALVLTVAGLLLKKKTSH